MRGLPLRALVAVSVFTLIQCGDLTRQPAAEPSAPASTPGDRSTAPSALPSASALPTATAGNVYTETLGGLAPSVAGIPPRVYVPNEKSNSVSIIDPVTLTVVGRIKVGAYPQHVTPSWDLLCEWGMGLVDGLGDDGALDLRLH